MSPGARSSRARRCVAWAALVLAALAAAGCAGRTEAEKARAAAPPDLAVRYLCDDQSRFLARFVFAEPRRVVIERHGREPLTLSRQEAASGFRYGDGRHLLAGRDEAAQWTEPGRAPARCRSKSPPPPYVPGSALTRPAG